MTALALNGETLAAGGANGRITLWNASVLAHVAGLTAITQADLDKVTHTAEINVHGGVKVTCVIIVDGFVYSGDADGKVYKTSVESPELTELIFDHAGKQMNDVAQCGDVLLFGTVNKVATYDVKQGKVLAPIPTRADIRSVSVDPSGAYLVTVGANKNVSLYQIQLVEGEFVYKKIMVASQSLTFINDVCRISWSPSGERFAVPNTTLDLTAKTIGMISRSNWKSEFSLVGQDATVVSFCPKVFVKDAKNYNIIASSGVDKTITVWNTTFQRPLFTAAEASSETISEIAWSSDGLTMYVAGDTIIVFVFEQSELGTPLPQETMSDLISKLKVPEPLQIKNKDITKDTAAPGTPGRTKSMMEAPKSPATAPHPMEKTISTPEISELTTEQIQVVQAVQPLQTHAIVTKDKDGRKRIAPTLVSTNHKPSLLPSQLNGSTSNTNEGSQVSMEFDLPSYGVPKDLKRREESEAPDSSDQPAAKKKRELQPVEFIGNAAINPSTAFSKIRISTPKIRSSFTFQSPDDTTLALDVKNGSGTEQKPTKISLLKNGTKQIFTDFVPKLICLAAGGEGDFWAVSTVDGILYIYSDSGRRLLPPIILGTPLSFLESKGKFLLAVTSLGEVYGWNCAQKKALFEPTSLYPLLSRSNTELLTRAENLTLCSISSGGVPIVTISNGNGYLFDKDMEAWTLISDSWWAFGSQYWDSGDGKPNGSLITMIEKRTNDEIVRRGRAKFLQKMAKTMLMKEGYENLEKTISLAHLENRMLISMKLKEGIEFKTHLIIYCKRISEMGFRARLLEIFEELLGPQNMNSDEPWDPRLLEFNKHDLLKELIFACANFRNVQRILVQFATAINILDQVALY